jgi:polyisoprenyl-phosphate glycosyltransferase
MPDDTHPSRKLMVAAIIPVYNEEKNVSGVLEVLRATSLLDQIILVDDGSSDKSVEILNQAAALDARIQVISHGTNKGKGQAIFSGWAATCAPVLLLLDADLKNLNPQHIRALLEPVLEHRTDMTLGLFRGGHAGTDFSHWVTPFLTGQRGLRADVLKHISREAATGYGFEVALTVATRKCNYRSRVVILNGVWHPSSEFQSKRGFWGGLYWRMRMYSQILRAWYVSSRERPPKAKAFSSNISKF